MADRSLVTRIRTSGGPSHDLLVLLDQHRVMTARPHRGGTRRRRLSRDGLRSRGTAAGTAPPARTRRAGQGDPPERIREFESWYHDLVHAGGLPGARGSQFGAAGQLDRCVSGRHNPYIKWWFGTRSKHTGRGVSDAEHVGDTEHFRTEASRKCHNVNTPHGTNIPTADSPPHARGRNRVGQFGTVRAVDQVEVQAGFEDLRCQRLRRWRRQLTAVGSDARPKLGDEALGAVVEARDVVVSASRFPWRSLRGWPGRSRLPSGRGR